MTTELPPMVRLIDARIPLANMALIMGIDAARLGAETIPAACAAYNRNGLSLVQRGATSRLEALQGATGGQGPQRTVAIQRGPPAA